jgi:curved DNA-binding protein CbpA
MKTVYDLLGVRPDASAEAIKTAFRAAVKLHHPDLHPGEPDASFRFSRIAAAYAILRDDKRRAAYDLRLALQRQRIQSMRMRIIISDARQGVLTIMLVIVFLWTETNLSMSIRTDKAQFHAAHQPTEMADLLSAVQDDATKRAGLRDGREVTSGRAIGSIAIGPATDSAGVQAIARPGPALRPLPDALGDMPRDRLNYVSAQR